MPTTTNYGWTTPADTDLVKDGASAIRTLGTAIDTTTKNLNPSTTLGDIEYRSSTANTNTRLGIGTSGQVLSVSGGVPAWTTISAGAFTLLSTTSLTGATTDITSISQSYNTLEIYIYGVTNATANGVFFCTPRNSTTSLTVAAVAPTSIGGSNEVIWGNAAGARLSTDGSGLVMDRTISDNFWVVRIANYASTTTYKSYEVVGSYQDTTDGRQEGRIVAGCVVSTSAVDGLRFSNSGGNLSTGTVKIYGVK